MTNKIISEYKTISVDGYVIWIDGLAEFEAGSAELKSLLKLAHELNGTENKELSRLFCGPND